MNDNVKEHNELIEKVQKYFKQVHCKEMAFELMNKIIEEYEMKYERNEEGEQRKMKRMLSKYKAYIS